MHVSPKIDGELWFMIIENDEVVLSNTRGKLIAGDIPLLSEVSKISSRFTGRSILAGELFVATKEGRPRVSDLASALGGGVKAEVEKIGFAAFDIISGGDAKSTMPLVDYKDRLELMERLLDGGKRVKCVKTKTINSPKEAIGYFEDWVEGGKAEGLIVRAGEGRIRPSKPSLSVDAVIIGYTEKSDDSSQVRSIIVALMRADETFQLLGSCGKQNEAKSRIEMMQKIQKSQVESNWRYTSGDGAIYRFVKPEVMVEIKGVDVQSEDSSGDPIRKMVLSYKDNEWPALQKLPCASIHHPVFVRYRSDKQMNTLDLRIEHSSACLNDT
jgi:ATP-dependent DNA ligase